MQTIRTIAELRSALTARCKPVLVPTMGNLHAGHLSLVAIARGRGAPVVASIFVNRLQFAPHEDFARYPRTFERDCKLLAAVGCDIVFAPQDDEIFPEPQEFSIQPPAELAGILEGAARPGFFTGVATVVLKLFNIVQPAAAIFGKKDYQQWRVVERMVRQLALPIDIVAAETVRDAAGLALSSRNGYLNEAQRAEAAQLHTTLAALAQGVRSGGGDRAQLQQDAMDALRARGWQPDYVAVRRRDDLREPSGGESLVALGAARLGDTRLLDNVEI